MSKLAAWRNRDHRAAARRRARSDRGAEPRGTADPHSKQSRRGPRSASGLRVLITIHPSALLRLRDEEEKRSGYDSFVHDLRAIQQIAAPAKRRRSAAATPRNGGGDVGAPAIAQAVAQLPQPNPLPASGARPDLGPPALLSPRRGLRIQMASGAWPSRSTWRGKRWSLVSTATSLERVAFTALDARAARPTIR